MKSIYVDTETTGTDPKKHALIQLAGVIVIDGMVKETFDFKIRPFKGDMLDPKALEVNKTTRQELETYPESLIQHMAFEKMLGAYIDKFDRTDKAHFIGWNADFDADFVRQFMIRHERDQKDYFGSWFYYPILDICKIAGFQLREIRHQFENFKLLTVAKHLGIEFDPAQAHNAAFDIDLTMRICDMCLDPAVPLKQRFIGDGTPKEDAARRW